MEPAQFYTGLVADLYGQLRSSTYDPAPYGRFIARCGQPALELGCGDGDPILDLVAQGLDIDGLDSSADMLERCRATAAERGLDVTLHCQPMESMELGRRYRSIYLAGPTFNLLADDTVAEAALGRIKAHLDDGGSAMIPLFVPEVPTAGRLGYATEATDENGRRVRCTVVSEERDEANRRQTTLLRYERVGPTATEVLEREWILHWFTQDGFRDLAGAAGLATLAVLDTTGGRATGDEDAFVFILALAP